MNEGYHWLTAILRNSNILRLNVQEWRQDGIELIILARNLTCIHHVDISLLLAVPDNHLSSIPLNSLSLSGVSFCGLTKYGYILLEKYYTQREDKSYNLTLSSGDSGTH